MGLGAATPCSGPSLCRSGSGSGSCHTRGSLQRPSAACARGALRAKQRAAGSREAGQGQLAPEGSVNGAGPRRHSRSAGAATCRAHCQAASGRQQLVRAVGLSNSGDEGEACAKGLLPQRGTSWSHRAPSRRAVIASRRVMQIVTAKAAGGLSPGVVVGARGTRMAAKVAAVPQRRVLRAKPAIQAASAAVAEEGGRGLTMAQSVTVAS
jgi:hypothetical protein